MDEISIGDRRVEALPAEVAPGEVVVITSGQARVALMPLARTDMGRGAAMRLVDMKGDLVFEMYNYQGAAKGFWEMRWPGYFFRGKPQCGVYLEVAERSAHRNGADFAHLVQSGKLVDTTETAFTSDGAHERLWTVEYTRDGKTVGIQVDLMAWGLKQRWTEQGERGWPQLEAPFAQQTSTGQVSAAGATLTCGKEPAWLYANPRSGLFVAGYHGKRRAPLTLRVPGGSGQDRGDGHRYRGVGQRRGDGRGHWTAGSANGHIRVGRARDRCDQSKGCAEPHAGVE